MHKILWFSIQEYPLISMHKLQKCIYINSMATGKLYNEIDFNDWVLNNKKQIS